MSNQLAAAAQAVIERWDARWDWKDQGPTADLIHALRQALAAHEAAKPAEPVAWLHPANASCVTTDPTAYARGIPLYAAPVAQAEPAWMPIETAPKDGSLLLLKEKWEDEPFIGQWVSSAYGGKWAASRTHYDTDGNACVIDRVYSKGVTHWQPLPPAPKEQQHAG